MWKKVRYLQNHKVDLWLCLHLRFPQLETLSEWSHWASALILGMIHIHLYLYIPHWVSVSYFQNNLVNEFGILRYESTSLAEEAKKNIKATRLSFFHIFLGPILVERSGGPWLLLTSQSATEKAVFKSARLIFTHIKYIFISDVWLENCRLDARNYHPFSCCVLAIP